MDRVTRASKASNAPDVPDDLERSGIELLLDSPLMVRVRAWCAPRPAAMDVALVVGVMAMTIGMQLAEAREGSETSMDGAGWALLIATVIPLGFRRRFAIPILYFVAGCTAAFWIRDYPDGGIGIGLAIAFFSVGAHVERRRATIQALVVAATVTAVVVIGVIIPDEDVPLVAVPSNLAIIATAFAVGVALRNRRAYEREAERRQQSNIARLQAEESRAVAEERTRIARELHDVVAHSMSVMVIQAGAARRVMAEDADAAAEALEVIETTGRASLTEMRRILGVLREDDGDGISLAPQPSAADLETLVASFDGAGLAASLGVEGDARDLPPGIELVLYRVVQEALTNCLKHAGPARAEVLVAYRPGHTDVVVRDDGRGASVAPGDGGGLGLLGMRERVEGIGGTFAAGPRRGGGFEVRATLPDSPAESGVSDAGQVSAR